VNAKENTMPRRSIIGALVASAALLMSVAGAPAADDARYPNLKGQWNRIAVPGLAGQPSFDQTKGWGLAQEAPLTPEYEAVLAASLADQAKGGHGGSTGYGCRSYGMPQLMQAYFPLELIVTPETTYILANFNDYGRRIFTDGRDWPKDGPPTYQGFSIGRWIDRGGEGRFDVLEVETRGPFKGPRAYDSTGIPLHVDNQSIFKERLYLDKSDQNILHDEITAIDHALTRPWTVDKKFTRSPNPRPNWPEYSCAESNAEVGLGDQFYFLSADGLLMPTRKDQPPPDLRYFKH
jgi:hypothetical protein